MRLGVNIPNFGPTATPEILRGWIDFARDEGFALAMVSDHVAATADVNELYPTPFYDCFATLAWLSAYAGDLDLGTSVTIVPYRHPLLTARLATTVDRLARGRFILGVGSGWAAEEFAALGVDFAHRGRITDEFLTTIAQVGTTPIWVGGTAAPALRRCARFGDAWHPNGAELSWLRTTGLPALRAAADRLDRPMPAFCPRVRARVTGRDLPGDRPIGVGSLAQVAADIEALVALGAESVVLDTNPDHPRDRRPPDEDWRNLAAVAGAVHG